MVESVLLEKIARQAVWTLNSTGLKLFLSEGWPPEELMVAFSSAELRKQHYLIGPTTSEPLIIGFKRKEDALVKVDGFIAVPTKGYFRVSLSNDSVYEIFNQALAQNYLKAKEHRVIVPFPDRKEDYKRDSDDSSLRKLLGKEIHLV